jgi:hypothetical protein
MLFLTQEYPILFGKAIKLLNFGNISQFFADSVLKSQMKSTDSGDNHLGPNSGFVT